MGYRVRRRACAAGQHAARPVRLLYSSGRCRISSAARRNGRRRARRRGADAPGGAGCRRAAVPQGQIQSSRRARARAGPAGLRCGAVPLRGRSARRVVGAPLASVRRPSPSGRPGVTRGGQLTVTRCSRAAGDIDAVRSQLGHGDSTSSNTTGSTRGVRAARLVPVSAQKIEVPAHFPGPRAGGGHALARQVNSRARSVCPSRRGRQQRVGHGVGGLLLAGLFPARPAPRHRRARSSSPASGGQRGSQSAALAVASRVRVRPPHNRRRARWPHRRARRAGRPARSTAGGPDRLSYGRHHSASHWRRSPAHLGQGATARWNPLKRQKTGGAAARRRSRLLVEVEQPARRRRCAARAVGDASCIRAARAQQDGLVR